MAQGLAHVLLQGMSSGDIGQVGEEIAAKLLVRNGYRVITRNYKKSVGEIDIIAYRDKTIHFVEVKCFSREIVDLRPEDNVHDLKIEKIGKTAEIFMHEYDVSDFSVQIDMIAVVLDIPVRRAYCKMLSNI